MRTSIYVALAAAAAITLGLSPVVRADGAYSGTPYSDRGYYSGSQTDSDVGMTNPARTDNLDQGRLDNRGTVAYDSRRSPSEDRTFSDQTEKYSDQKTGREGTSWDVGMTNPGASDNLDQGRLDNRGFIGGQEFGSPSIDRGRYNDTYRNYSEARAGNLHDVRDMLGMEVLDANGKHLGTIENFVADGLGRIDFAVLNTDMKEVAVPFQALTYDGRGHYTLNMTEDQLAAAPAFDQAHLADRTWPGHVYRYYGLTPRW